MGTAKLTLRAANPEQLDRMVRVVPPLGWLVFAVFALVVLGGVVWAAVSTAPVKLTASGILQGSGGVVLVSAPASAPLVEMRVRVGSRVAEGEIVARLDEPVLDARMAAVEARLAALASERTRIEAFHAREREVYARADAQRRQGLERSLQQAQEREAALLQQGASQRDLLTRGFATRDRILTIDADVARARQDVLDARNSLNRLVIDADERAMRSERELMEADTKVAQARRELAEIAAERAGRAEVRAPVAGRVVELSAAPGDRVQAGAALMRLIPDQAEAAADTLVGILYAHAGDGKKVRAGMPVQIVPSTVRVQRDGFILGEVIDVSEIPATREALQQTLKNDAFVTKLMADGPPFELRVALRRDPHTVSGFAWSSSLGATRAVESGTVIQGAVVVERVRLLALVIPEIDALLHAAGFDR
ncbi:hypothetical protein TSO221_32100 [Azospirillum sp. TSO22-1]|nr:NHLP bacteriocin system secretion protein [Azospirillum sp. TSO22-1]PWC31957.1 hypothetical protein TSO221_32100 [Azospirillum sp. TSO22-1]